jgi:hypothetical protein
MKWPSYLAYVTSFLYAGVIALALLALRVARLRVSREWTAGTARRSGSGRRGVATSLRIRTLPWAFRVTGA